VEPALARFTRLVDLYDFLRYAAATPNTKLRQSPDAGEVSPQADEVLARDRSVLSAR